MKKSLLLICACLGIFFIIEKPNLSNKYVQAENGSISTTSNSEIQVPKIENDKQDIKSHTVSLNNMSIEELYTRFGYLTDDQIDNYSPDLNDTDKVVAPSGGGIIGSINGKGNATSEKISNDGLVYNVAEINPNTDPNAITYREFKDFLKKNQEELYKIYQNE